MEEEETKKDLERVKKVDEIFADAFHKHLDGCVRCREHPFDLCDTGRILLSCVGRTIGR